MRNVLAQVRFERQRDGEVGQRTEGDQGAAGIGFGKVDDRLRPVRRFECTWCAEPRVAQAVTPMHIRCVRCVDQQRPLCATINRDMASAICVQNRAHITLHIGQRNIAVERGDADNLNRWVSQRHQNR